VINPENLKNPGSLINPESLKNPNLDKPGKLVRTQ
jgi:hypothetical protein